MTAPRPQKDLTSGGVRNILTFDVEEYFHASIFEKVVTPDQWPQLESRVEGNVERILDLLDRYQVMATFFVLGWIGEHHPWVVKKIAAFGHEVACHGYDHQLIHEMSPEGFRKQLTRSLDILQGLTGKKILGFRAPSFSIKEDTLWAFEILAEMGIRYDSSIFPIFHDRYGMPQTPRQKFKIRTDHGAEIVELPPSSIRILGQNLPFGGGGYFRLFPLWFTNWSLRRINQRGLPVVFYLHPWELDPEQPALEIGFWETFRHYSNLKIVERKLKRLLQTFQFLPICEFLELEQFQSERIATEKLSL
ncbi:MAG: XrtA system polysaccharide deacetylase [Candidatus Zixiibacteriota bacterium]